MKRDRKKLLSRENHRHSRHEYGQSWMLAAALIDRPMTLQEFEEYYRIMGRRFGVYVDILDHGRAGNSTSSPKTEKNAPGSHTAAEHGTKLRLTVERGLQVLLSREWAIVKDGTYHITDEGRKEARIMLDDLERSGRILERATHPETVSKVTLIVHFILATIKLPAAIVSGSVGLLNDALDTLMDGISSLCVFFGVRAGRERLVSYLLLLFMTITGGYTLVEAVLRFINPEPLTADWTAFIAVTISGGLCALLWLYQKYTGLKHSCVPLIAQSIDSRNHIIVAAGVAAGLIAALFNFSLLDQIVGIVVAVLILKGAAELLIDLLRSSGDEDIDLSKYGFGRIDAQRKKQMVRWFLFEIENGRITSKEHMLNEARIATDFSMIASFRALGIDCQPDREEKLQEALRAVFDEGLAVEIQAGASPVTDNSAGIVQLTEAGEEELKRALANSWSFRHDGPPAAGRGIIPRFLSVVLRLFFAALAFFLVYTAVRWIIGFLPNLDVWQTIAFIPEITFGLAFGPVDVNGVQLILLACGIVFFYRGRTLMHRARHLIHHAKEGGGDQPVYLVNDGPFAARRHPMYAGMILLDLGVGIGLHSVYTLVWAAFSILLKIVNMGIEEKRLAAWFGDRYSHYQSSVPLRLFSWKTWALLCLLYTAAWMGALFR